MALQEGVIIGLMNAKVKAVEFYRAGLQAQIDSHIGKQLEDAKKAISEERDIQQLQKKKSWLDSTLDLLLATAENFSGQPEKNSFKDEDNPEVSSSFIKHNSHYLEMNKRIDDLEKTVNELRKDQTANTNRQFLQLKKDVMSWTVKTDEDVVQLKAQTDFNFDVMKRKHRDMEIKMDHVNESFKQVCMLIVRKLSPLNDLQKLLNEKLKTLPRMPPVTRKDQTDSMASYLDAAYPCIPEPALNYYKLYHESANQNYDSALGLKSIFQARAVLEPEDTPGNITVFCNTRNNRASIWMRSATSRILFHHQIKGIVLDLSFVPTRVVWTGIKVGSQDDERISVTFNNADLASQFKDILLKTAKDCFLKALSTRPSPAQGTIPLLGATIPSTAATVPSIAATVPSLGATIPSTAARPTVHSITATSTTRDAGKEPQKPSSGVFKFSSQPSVQENTDNMPKSILTNSSKGTRFKIGSASGSSPRLLSTRGGFGLAVPAYASTISLGPFSAAFSGKIIFGTPVSAATPGSNVVDAPDPAATTGSIVAGAPVSTATTGSIVFGAPVPTATTGSIVFGAPVPAATQGSNVFNAPTPAATQGSNVFGAPVPTATTGSIVFGAPVPAATQGSNVFDAPTPAATQGSNVFGAPVPAATQGSNVFGAPVPAATQGCNVFSAPVPAATQGSNVFGASLPAATQGNNVFGAPLPAATQGSNVFDAPTPAATQGSNVFGAPVPAATTASIVFAAPAPAATTGTNVLCTPAPAAILNRNLFVVPASATTLDSKLFSASAPAATLDIKQFADVDDSASHDVIFLGEERPTQDQIDKAREYRLPDHFYLYLNKPPCPGCIGCNDGELPDTTTVSTATTAVSDTVTMSTTAETKQGDDAADGGNGYEEYKEEEEEVGDDRESPGEKGHTQNGSGELLNH